MTLSLPLAPPDAARLLLQAWLRVNGGAGSGNFGHSGRPGEVGGSTPEGDGKSEITDIGSNRVTVWRNEGSDRIKLQTGPMRDHVLPPGYAAVLNVDVMTTGVGAGYRLYKAALGHMQARGFEGIASERAERNSASNKLWDSMRRHGANIDTVEVEGKTFDVLKHLELHTLGGPGSGNFGHSGRPGEVGGSGEGGSSEESQVSQAMSGGGGTYYHGTASDALASIKKSGLKPAGAQGADAWVRSGKTGGRLETINASIGGRPASVYVTPFFDKATEYAEYAQAHRGTNEKPLDAVVLRVQIPQGWNIKSDEAEEERAAFRIEGIIPPRWITGVTRINEYNDPTEWRALADGAIVRYVVVFTEVEQPKTAASVHLPVHTVADASVNAIKKAFKDSVSSAGITDPASALALIEQNGARLREALAAVLLRVVVASGQVHARALPKRAARAAEASFGSATPVTLHGTLDVLGEAADFDDAAEGLRSLAPQKPGTAVGVTFDTANPAAVAWARDRAAALVKDITDDQRQSIRDLVAGSLNKDLSRRELVRDIEDVIGLTSKQGEGLMALREQLEAEGLDRSEIDDEVSARSGEMFDDRAEMIAHTECLPGESLVDGAVVGAVHRRWYAGDVVQVTTRGGRHFTATQNHPMLTSRGWLAAGKIQEGDDLVCYGGEKDFPPVELDVAAPPTTLAQLYETAVLVGVVERRVTTPRDFHGDGMDGYVDIANPHRPLPVGVFAPLYKPLVEKILAPSDESATLFCLACGRLLPIHQRVCLCHGSQGDSVLQKKASDEFRADVKRNSNSTSGLAGQVAGRDIFNGKSDGDGRAFVPSDATTVEEAFPGVRPTAQDSGSPNNVVYPVGARSKLFSNEVAAQPRQIELDRVLSVALRPFSGHVYNLSTPYGYYTINRGIYTGNSMAAANQGQLELWDQAVADGWLTGDEQKVWIATPDTVVCDDCETLDGETVGLDEEFSMGGDPPLHPFCRCTVALAGMPVGTTEEG